MSEWWGGKKANLDYWSYYWILSCERSAVCRIEENRRWPPFGVLAEGIHVPGRGIGAAAAKNARGSG